MWLALNELDDWTANRADRNAGVIAATAANAMGAKKEDGGLFTAADFAYYARLQEDPEALAAREQEEISRRLRAWLTFNSGHKAKAN